MQHKLCHSWPTFSLDMVKIVHDIPRPHMWVIRNAAVTIKLKYAEGPLWWQLWAMCVSALTHGTNSVALPHFTLQNVVKTHCPAYLHSLKIPLHLHRAIVSKRFHHRYALDSLMHQTGILAGLISHRSEISDLKSQQSRCIAMLGNLSFKLIFFQKEGTQFDFCSLLFWS